MKISPKRLRRHLYIAILVLISVAFLFVAFGQSNELWVDEPTRKAESISWRLSMSFAYSAVAFLAITLIIGPLNILRQKPNPTNSMLRRDIGIWAAILALAHMAIGLTIHSDGWQLWTLFIHQFPTRAHPIPIRFNKFGLANFLGLLQGTILLFLLFISNNRVLKKLGLQRWKWFQRLTYVAFLSILAHGFLYQRIEMRTIGLAQLFLSVMGLVILVQAAGFIKATFKKDSMRLSDQSQYVVPPK